MCVMSHTWSVMNNTPQIRIYGHPGLARYRLPCMICPAAAMKSHGFHLSGGRANVLRAAAFIYPYLTVPLEAQPHWCSL